MLRRSRSLLFVAMLYEVSSLIEPDAIKISFLNRICGTNMQGFFCICKWQAVYLDESQCLMHVRSQHSQIVHRSLILIRKT